jgi:tetratricopeptide (TPR) repeat protein
VEVLRRLTKTDPTNTEFRRNLALDLLALGDLTRDGDDLAAARKLYEESLSMSERLAEADPTNLSWQLGLVTVLNRLADVAGRLDDAGTAFRCHEQAAAVNRHLLRDRPDDAVRLRELSYNLYYIGTLHEAAGHVPEGLHALREAVALHRRAVERAEGYAKEHGIWTAAYQRLVLQAGDELLETAREHLMLAYLLHAREDYQRATEQFAKALEDAGIRSDLPRGNLYNAACAAALAELPEKAIEWLTEDLRLRREELASIETRMESETDPAVAETLSRRAGALQSHFEHARVKDPDLESLRPRPEFAALFD